MSSRRTRRVLITVGLGTLLAVLTLNAIAYMHARAMTHFTAGGARTGRPESLGLGEKVRTLLFGVNVPKPTNALSPADYGLAFEAHKCASSDGVELEAWSVPCAPSRGLVLLFHGYAACKAAQLPVAKALHELGHEILMIDFRGSGGSSGTVTTLGVREAEDVAVALAFAATRSPESPVLYGTSMGSVAILRAVHAHGVRPKALVLECPFGRLIDTTRARFALMGVPAFPSAELLVFWGGFQHGFDGFSHDAVNYARSVRCPTLLMHGGNDPTVSFEQTTEIYDRLGGAKKVVSFPGVRHESYLEARPKDWKAAVGEFLGGAPR